MSLHLAQILKMYEAYTAGATLEAVGAQFRCTKSAVQKGFKNWGLPVRNAGSPRREVVDLPRTHPIRSIALIEANRSYVWCAQCDRRVSHAEADQCGSRFCKAAQQAIGLSIAGHEADRARREHHG